VKIPLEEEGKQKIFKTSLVSSFKYNIDGTGVVEATFHPDLKPYLLRLKNRFLMYDMKNVLNISSANSIRMYELLKSFEGIRERTFYVEELKEILGVEQKYDRYYNFKKRIIEQAQKDLFKHTDIAFTFDEIKKP
jgi:plasmid replication initiation protein